jgi:hypothetical protein
MSKHNVKSHHWRHGILETIDHFFDSFEESLLFANNVDAHMVKIYSPDGELLNSIASPAVPDQINVRSDESYA